MKHCFYLSFDPNMGFSPSHFWMRHTTNCNPGRWWVGGTSQFTISGPAVINDFGTLVEVPR